MSKIAVVGSSSVVEVFSALGVETFVVKNKVEAVSLINKLVSSEFSLIFVTKSVCENIPKILKKQELNLKTVISEIPG